MGMNACGKMDKPMLSPFEAVLDKSVLPTVFQEQFLLSVESAYTVQFEGRMNRIWHRPAWLGPVFRLLARFNILFAETGRDVAASMRIIGGRDGQHQPLHRWNRTFTFTPPRYFNAVMTYDTRRKAVTEYMGPGGFIQMMWNVNFLAPDQIEISTQKCYLALGRLRVALPRFLSPSVRALETAFGEDSIRIELTVSHSRFGPVFGYEGQFQVRRVPIQP